MNLEWKQVNENTYQIFLDNDLIGVMFRDINCLWNLNISRFSISEKNQCRENLVEYAETKIEKTIKIKHMPVAFCTVCNECSANISVINQPHRRTKYGDKCKGVFSSAICYNDWIICTTCNGTGKFSEQKCDQCDGWGWILNRRL